MNNTLSYTNTTPFVTKKITESEKNIRLDKFLTTQMPDYSRNQLIRFINEGCVINNTTPTLTLAPDYKVKEHDFFTITPPNAIDADPTPENIPLDILYEDTDLLVINKPHSMVVHPGAGNYSHTLVNALLYHCKGSLSGIGGVKRPGIVHRIDKDTSGILVVAKNDFTHTHLSKQFETHTVERIYTAFVYGQVDKMGTVHGNIGRCPQNRQKMTIVKQGGKTATTHFTLENTYKNGLASKIKCTLETGRTHQIRVHLTSIKHNLIGDTTYGTAPKSAPEYVRFFPRQALHAGFLAFIHPKSGGKLAFTAPLPPDLVELETYLSML